MSVLLIKNYDDVELLAYRYGYWLGRVDLDDWLGVCVTWI